MEHWATVLDIIEAGLAGDREKVRAYAELLLERLGEVPPVVPHLRRILDGEAPGRPVLPAARSQEDG